MQEAGRSWTTIRPSRAPVRRPCSAQCWKCIHTRTSLRPPDVVAARRVSLLLARSQPKPGAEERTAFDSIDQLKEEEVITTAAEAPPAETVGVRIALAVLNFYKREISPLIPPSCRFVPTCSEYGMEAYKRFGVPKGTVLTAWRLLNCNPLGAVLLPRMDHIVIDSQGCSFQFSAVLVAVGLPTAMQPWRSGQRWCWHAPERRICRHAGRKPGYDPVQWPPPGLGWIFKT